MAGIEDVRLPPSRVSDRDRDSAMIITLAQDAERRLRLLAGIHRPDGGPWRPAEELAGRIIEQWLATTGEELLREFAATG